MGPEEAVMASSPGPNHPEVSLGIASVGKEGHLCFPSLQSKKRDVERTQGSHSVASGQ